MLTNTLPSFVVETLLNGSSRSSTSTASNEMRLAETYENVTVMFCDIVGFTEMSRMMKADELVQLINRYGVLLL